MLTRIEATFRHDARVLAAWLGGSFGRGVADEWSDIDLYVVIRNDDFAVWLTERGGLFERLGRPLLIGPEVPSFTTAEGAFQSVLFAGPVAVDMDVLPSPAAARDADTHLLFERIPIPVRAAAVIDDEERRAQLERDLGFFWAMTPIALKYIGRGRTHRAVTQIDLLSETFVRIWRLTRDLARRDAGAAYWLHPDRDAELIRHIPRLDVTIDPRGARDVVTRLMDEVRRLHPALEQIGVVISADAVQEIDRFRDDVMRELDVCDDGAD